MSTISFIITYCTCCDKEIESCIKDPPDGTEQFTHLGEEVTEDVDRMVVGT